MNEIARKVLLAEARIRPHVRETPLEPSPALAGDSGTQLFLKCENLQHTGSFKVRGALNKVLSLTPAEVARGVVTASTGNHGAAVAYALRQIGASATVYVPQDASPTKLAGIERLGGRIEVHGADSSDSEVWARAQAERSGATYISPYNDVQVAAGQGTVAVELLRQLDRFDAIFVSVGGGGLIGGIAARLRAALPRVRIIGCSPENSQVMIQSVQAGRILDLPSLPTLSDGTAGGVEAGSITFALARDLVDEFCTVTEQEIGAAMRRFMEAHHMLIEGDAGVALAAFEKHKAAWAGARVVVVLCGANIGLQTLKRILP